MIPKKPSNATWTDEQWEAIYEDGKNIIVSAGAGSGKTAVLTERVIRKLKDGVHVNELLILTFTKAAAGEMADRIRKKIKKIPELADELNLLDAAYITTFDSFALSVVKKYHCLINVSSNIGIIDSSVIELEKQSIMEELFLEKYKDKDQDFLEVIKSFCVKDDSAIRNYILNISNKLDLLSNKKEYLENYLDNYYNKERIDKDINKYVGLINNKIELIKELVTEISYLDNEFASKISDSLEFLYDANGYDDIVRRLNIKLPIAPRGSDDELKSLKSDISDVIKEIKILARYKDKEEIRKTINLTYRTVKVIIDVILEFTDRILKYKNMHDAYEFNDIAIMAIEILKNNKWVRDELFNSFNEIMIDEYQDTNDLQEEFISMISNHNVYMVGDIKQSIYRFRNANPYIFKKKYDDYNVSNMDRKIDLNKNFRSRGEVLDNINVIFNLVMDDMIGGANYIASHQMSFGNTSYLKEDPGHSNDMDVYTYNYDKECGYSREEVETFMIARDIKDKYDSKYQVFDKDSGALRAVTYSDFAIIMDRATNFDLYKKVFSYMGIPLTILKDERMNDSLDVMVIRNLIGFIIKIKNKRIDTEFKYLFVSLLRSFLYDIDDDKIFEYFVFNNYTDSDLYKKCLEISKKIDYITINDLLDLIIEEFNYYYKLITIGNIHSRMVKLDKIKEIGANLESLGYDNLMFYEYLSELTNKGYSMEYKVSDNGSDAVLIMTIHKSKGLEYPVCYFCGLYKSFNISDLKERFLVDKDYGIIVPYFKEGIGETIYKELLRDKYLLDEISEKIRLFYVALTRAREKVIIVRPYNDKVNSSCNDTVLSNNLRKKYRSLADIIDSVDFRIREKVKDIDITKLGLTKDYNLVKVGNYKESISKCDTLIDVCEINVGRHEITSESFSKKSNKLISKQDYSNMSLGSKIHEVLELIDLKCPDYGSIDDKFVKVIVRKFLKSDLLKNIGMASVYKEYEFIYEEDNMKYHGIIDLMLEYDDHIDIIDYKLKNTKDSYYNKQIAGYKNYISSKTDKVVNTYLYSLIEGIVYEIN